MPASVWSGYLTFGLISMPVRLYSGARGSRVSFHMLHRDDHVRVKQQLVCPAENKVIGHDEIVKGYEYSKGQYVVLEPSEIKKIEPKTAKAMEVLEFIRAEEVDPIYFEASYYLLPEEAGRRSYLLLAEAMAKRGDFAVAKLTMHNREYTVILRPYRHGLMLHTMYYQDEVRPMDSDNFAEAARDLQEGELKVAQQLIEALEVPWEPAKFHDTFAENLKELIQARLEGAEIKAVEKPPKLAPPTDLIAALKESLAQLQKKPAAETPKREETPPATARKRSGRKTERAA